MLRQLCGHLSLRQPLQHWRWRCSMPGPSLAAVRAPRSAVRLLLAYLLLLLLMLKGLMLKGLMQMLEGVVGGAQKQRLGR